MPGSSTSQPFIFDSAGDSRRGPAGRSFAGNSLGSGNQQGEPLLQQTKREIAQMLRELAAAARDEIPAEKFTSILCDRTLRAMSAEGVVIWESSPNTAADNSPAVFRPLARLGRVTDRSIVKTDAGQTDGDQTNPSTPSSSSAAWSAHQCLLATIAADGEPAVVPSTPDVSEPNVPANPTSTPAALVPIDSPSFSSSSVSSSSRTTPSRVIEVFLEPDGGIATQRGYLRFVCQVADLAGEYFRSEQLRSLLWQQSLAEKCDQFIARLHELDHSEKHRKNHSGKLATLVVDEIADIFQLDRVAISRIGPKSKTRIIAVSHVETIDQHSQSADQIRTVSETTLDSTGAAWLAAENDSTRENKDEATAAITAPFFAASGIHSQSNQADHGYRLTGYRRADKPPMALREFEKRELLRTVGHTLRSIQQRDRSRQSTWARLVRRQSTDGRTSLHRVKRFASLAVIAAVVALVMIIPVPKTIQATATLRAQDTQRICAVGDAVVETIRVKHGQHVRAGDVLMTLSDSNLEQQITTLVGRRAVLAEQKTRLTEDMVDSSASDFDSYEKIQGQRSVVDEEIASVNQQLALLRESKASLTIRSDRDGVVDAWQIAKRLSGRPVNRGDSLLQVVSHDSAWLVDAEVSQSRIGRVRRADQANELSARVTIDDAPGLSCVATNWQFGPTRPAGSSSTGDSVRTAITLTLGTARETLGSARETLSTARATTDAPTHMPPTINRSSRSSQIGAPAHVYFHCGSVPLGDLLAGDLYRDIRSHLALHWRFPDTEGSQSF